MNQYGYTVLCEPDRGPDDTDGLEPDHEYVIDIHLSVAVTINPSQDDLDVFRAVLAENAAEALMTAFQDNIDGWHILEDNGATDSAGEPL